MTDYPFPDFDFEEDEIISREFVLPPKAMTERSLGRRLALQALYEIDSSQHNVDVVLKHFLSDDGQSVTQALREYFTDDEEPVRVVDMIQNRMTPENEEVRVITYFNRLVRGVEKVKATLDVVIQTFASEFPLQSVSIVDRNILRIAFYELAYATHLPVIVVADEAVDLARVFGSETAPRFVNGVLGAVVSNLESVRDMLKSLAEQEKDDAPPKND